jgi:hypothetical protein
MRQPASWIATTADDISAASPLSIFDAEEACEALVDAVIARERSGFVMFARRRSEPADRR